MQLSLLIYWDIFDFMYDFKSNRYLSILASICYSHLCLIVPRCYAYGYDHVRKQTTQCKSIIFKVCLCTNERK